MKRLFRVKKARTRQQWWVIASHFPAAQKVSEDAKVIDDKDKVSFIADLTQEYLDMGFGGLGKLLRSRKDRIVDITTELLKTDDQVKKAVRKFVPAKT